MNASLEHSLSLIGPELLLLVGALAGLLVGAVRGNKSTYFLHFLALALMALAFVGALNLPALADFGFNGLLRVDAFTQFSKVLVLVGAIMAAIVAVPWLAREEHHKFEYPLLLLLAVVGMMVMLSANNLLTVYMGLELSSLALYVLACFDRDNLRSSEAGLKYFVLGALASGMFLFGASLIYGFTGTTDFAAMREVIVSEQAGFNPGLLVGMVFLMVGFLFKISAAPFHMWTPDVYQGAPAPVTAFFAVAPKIAAIALLMRILNQPFAGLVLEWQQIIVTVSLLSMLVGAFGALMQQNIKRLLAYSSIGHVGYALIGVAAASTAGAQAVLVYLSLYVFMGVGMFGFVLLMQRNGKPLESLTDLAGLGKASPRAALFVSIMMFSMAGIPPLAGFFGKMFIFLSAIESGMYTLAIIGVLSSVVAAYYYIKIVKIMYFDESEDAIRPVADKNMRVVLTACAFVALFFVLAPGPLLEVAQQAALALQ